MMPMVLRTRQTTVPVIGRLPGLGDRHPYRCEEFYNEYHGLRHRELILFHLQCNGTGWSDRDVP